MHNLIIEKLLAKIKPRKFPTSFPAIPFVFM